MRDKNHIAYYLLLSSILIGGLLLIFSSSNKTFQMLIVMLSAILYVFIGIVHHLINHDLVAKIVIEYILIASLGIALSFFIFRGGLGF